MAFLLLLAAAGCGQRKAGNFEPLPFPAVSVPNVVAADEASVLDYLAGNYWNRLTDTTRTYPCDSLLVSGVRKADVEAAFSSYITILQSIGPDAAKKSLRHTASRAVACERRDTSSNVMETLGSFVEKYLYDANSPVRFEDFYAAYMAEVLRDSSLTVPQREYHSYQVQLCGLNMVGTPAADFSFCDADGVVTSLYDIRAEYTVILFSNPGCTACKEIITALSTPEVSALVKEGKVAVANIYIDEDIEAWYGYMPIYPDDWYNGYDPDYIIRGEMLYNVRAIPSLYLLDADKTVLLKDAPLDAVLAALSSV